MNQKGRIRRFVALACILFSSMVLSFAAELPELAKLKIAAEGGDAYAQFQLAGEFDSKMDYTQAEAWLRKSASSGFAPAQGELGARLLRKYRSSFGQAGQTKAAAGREAITWLAAGAAQANARLKFTLATSLNGSYFILKRRGDLMAWLEIRHSSATNICQRNSNLLARGRIALCTRPPTELQFCQDENGRSHH